MLERLEWRPSGTQWATYYDRGNNNYSIPQLKTNSILWLRCWHEQAAEQSGILGPTRADFHACQHSMAGSLFPSIQTRQPSN